MKDYVEIKNQQDFLDIEDNFDIFLNIFNELNNDEIRKLNNEILDIIDDENYKENIDLFFRQMLKFESNENKDKDFYKYTHSYELLKPLMQKMIDKVEDYYIE